LVSPTAGDAGCAVEVDRDVRDAIREGVEAGVYRRAQRLNPRTAGVWDEIARPHSERATTLLNEAMQRLGVGRTRPCSHGI
jgi:hypothetical protein